ncbi:hypothetical protein [Pseudoclavibacter helvolus]|uniref:hypothetical protein n=1 Tax=Pseudoclavibacter helvolus TaxID=255205 RepID=UPI003C79010B
MSRTLPLAVAAFAVLALAGCSPAAAPAPTTAPSATASPTPTSPSTVAGAAEIGPQGELNSLCTTLSGGATGTTVISQTNQPSNAQLWSAEIGSPRLGKTSGQPDAAVDLASIWKTNLTGVGDIYVATKVPGQYQATGLVMPADLPVVVLKDDAGCGLTQVLLPVDLPEIDSTDAETIAATDLRDDRTAGNAVLGWVPSAQLAPERTHPLKTYVLGPDIVTVTDASGATVADFELFMGTSEVSGHAGIGMVTSVSPDLVSTTLDRYGDGSSPIAFIPMGERESFIGTPIPAFPDALAELATVVTPGDLVVIAPRQ